MVCKCRCVRETDCQGQASHLLHPHCHTACQWNLAWPFPWIRVILHQLSSEVPVFQGAVPLRTQLAQAGAELPIVGCSQVGVHGFLSQLLCQCVHGKMPEQKLMLNLCHPLLLLG